jgi:5-carboxymethyl-2-hydroxymuconate isomerase
MPHLTLEITDNVAGGTRDLWATLNRLHAVVAATGLFEERDLKGRAVVHSLYAAGVDAPERGFVALTVEILAGRAPEVRARLADDLMAVLARDFAPALEGGHTGLSVQIREMDRESYRRVRPRE